MMAPSRAVLGVGNVLMGDDGLGVHAIWALQRRVLPKGVELIDGGTQGLALMDLVRGVRRLVVIDCIRAGQEPGTLYRIELDELSRAEAPRCASLHQAGVRELLDLLGLVGEVPKTTLVGMEPLCLGMGQTLSEPVEARLSVLVDLCLHILAEDPPCCASE